MTTNPTELPAEVWQARAAEHATRVDAFTAPHLQRRRDGRKHPVHDFLFTYYSYRPAQLRRWHPGFGIRLAAAAAEYADLPHYVIDRGGAEVDRAHLAEQRPLLERTLALLRATASRTGSFGCFGLHEWAMVYRLTPQQVRHTGWPLRLGAAGTNEVVEGHRINCSHFDAFRFFTAPARPLNVLQPARDDRVDFEQPACLHATMDLYKHAFRLSPLIGSDLVFACFTLAWRVREFDMRAAPYDLSSLTLHDGTPWSPVAIETPEGKAEYAEAQRGFAAAAAPLRQELIEVCEELLGAEVSAPTRASEQ